MTTRQRRPKRLLGKDADGKPMRQAFSRSAWENVWEAKHAHDRCRGRKLTDMPGLDMDIKKMNWFLFRRGLLDELPGKRWAKWNRKQASKLMDLKQTPTKEK